MQDLPEVIRDFIAPHPQAEFLTKIFLELSEAMQKEAEDYFSYATYEEKEAIIDWILANKARSEIPSVEDLEEWYHQT